MSTVLPVLPEGCVAPFTLVTMGGAVGGQYVGAVTLSPPLPQPAAYAATTIRAASNIGRCIAVLLMGRTKTRERREGGSPAMPHIACQRAPSHPGAHRPGVEARV